MPLGPRFSRLDRGVEGELRGGDWGGAASVGGLELLSDVAALACPPGVEESVGGSWDSMVGAEGEGEGEGESTRVESLLRLRSGEGVELSAVPRR